MRYPKPVTTTLLCVVTSWCILPAARADEASEYLAAAGDEADALTACIMAYAKPLVGSSKAAGAVADDAMAACGDKIGALRIALMGPPTNLTEAKASSEVEVVKKDYRGQLVEVIGKVRSGEAKWP